MKKNGIPKYVQVLNRSEPEKDEKEHLIKVYALDGVQIDDEMTARNPNAKQRVLFITSTKPRAVMQGAEEFQGKDEKMNHWIYCGRLWYVRKVKNKYQFAQYMTYNTESKKNEGLWDQRDHK